jgi:hypothetical protein
VLPTLTLTVFLCQSQAVSCDFFVGCTNHTVLSASLADGELPGYLKQSTHSAHGFILPLHGIFVRRLARTGCFAVVRLRHHPTAKQEAADSEYLHVREHVHFGQNTHHMAAYKQSPAVSDVSLPDYVYMWALVMMIYHGDRNISDITLSTHLWCSW